jgi:hypothetical protein
MISFNYDDWDEALDHPSQHCRDCDADGATFSGEYDTVGEAVYLCPCCKTGGHGPECDCAE